MIKNVVFARHSFLIIQHLRGDIFVPPPPSQWRVNVNPYRHFLTKNVGKILIFRMPVGLELSLFNISAMPCPSISHAQQPRMDYAMNVILNSVPPRIG